MSGKRRQPQPPPAPVLRICARFSRLPAEQCSIPDRCQTRACSVCGQAVHYDPTCSISILGTEVIVCEAEDCWGRFVRRD